MGLFTFVVPIFLLTAAQLPAVPIVPDTFGGILMSGWTLQGAANWSAAGSQTSVQLTGLNNNQTGMALENTAMPFAAGFDISFQYSVWGGSGADGFALVLVDGSVNPQNPGGYGGSLGYAQRDGVNGLQGAILGLGFDEYGNFANATEGRQGGVGFTPDAVTIRGPGDGTDDALTASGATNYAFLTTSGNLPGSMIQNGSPFGGPSNSDSESRTAEVIADTTQISSGHLPVSIYITAGSGAKTLVASYDAYKALVAYYGSPVNIPATVRIGFTGSTGGSTDYHAIQNLQISNLAIPDTDICAVPEISSATMGFVGVLLIMGGKLRRKGGSRS